MDSPFIKEEPVEYALILTNDGEELLDEKITNIDDNHANLMDIYTISIKEESTDAWTNYHDGTNVTAEYESKESLLPENLENDDVIDGSSDEDWTIKKNASKSKPSKSRNGQIFRCSECPATFYRRCFLRSHLKKHVNLSDKECCHICKTFYPKSVMEFHLLLHKGPPFVCQTCGKEFMNKDSFRGHNKIHRTRNFECDICHKKFLSKALVSSHIEIHIEREKTFQCQICKISFFRRNTLLRHIRNLHSTTPRKKYKCQNPLCQREYVRNNDLKNHKCRNRPEPMLKQGKRMPERKVKCSLCSMRFFKESKLEFHFNRCHSAKSKPSTKLLSCEKCKKLFRDSHRLVLHNKQNCSLIVMYECELCSKRVQCKRRLLNHFANYHKINALKTVACNHCDKKFTNGSLLAKHLRTNVHRTPPIKKPIILNRYECDFCRRLFQIKYHCTQHMESSCTLRTDFMDGLTEATDSQRFECEMCQCVFKRKRGIVEHMKIMHSKVSLSGKCFMKKFTCFMNKAILRQYPCCDKNYDGIAINPQHVNTAECKFKCKKCRISFADFYSLLRHCAQHTMKVHQSLRHMQQCKRCNELFKWKHSIPEQLRSVKSK